MKNVRKIQKKSKELSDKEKAILAKAANENSKDDIPNSSTKKNAAGIKTKPLSIALDEEIKKKFKTIVALREDKMTPLIIEWINNYIDENRDLLPNHLK